MNLLYSDAEQEKNCWEYTSDVGYIPKPTGGGGNEEKDREQDEKIEENAQAIADNENRDDTQQAQIDANTQAIADNERRDDAQQEQIDDVVTRLNQNFEDDERQQSEIDDNKTKIIRIESELPTLEMEGTMLVIGKKGDS